MNHHTGSCGIVDIFAECERREFRSLRNEAWVGVVKAVSRCKAIIKRRREGGRPHSGAQGESGAPFLCSPLVAGVAVYAFLGGVHT